MLEIIASAPTDLGATLPKIAEAATVLCEADGAAVVFVDGDTVQVGSGALGNVSLSLDSLVGETTRTLSGAAFVENTLVEVGGPIDDWAAEYPGSASPFRELGLSEPAAIAVPLPSRDGPIGALLVIRGNGVAFTGSCLPGPYRVS